MNSPASLLTVGEIARRVGQPRHRVEYLIRSRQIVPCGWAGHARIFQEADFDHVAAELQRIDRDRFNSNRFPELPRNIHDRD